MTQEAMKLVLEALEELYNTNSNWWQEVDEQTLKKIEHSITAIEEALAQPEQDTVQRLSALVRAQQITIEKLEQSLAQTQEPVSSDPLPRACNLAGVDYQTFLKIKAYMPVTPPQRTETKIGCVNHDCDKCKAQRTWVGLTDNEIALINADYPLPQGFAKAIEAKLKQKNT